jgi:glyoxylase-like metal-dependent hydrolase (beta-lactamase superfamily II)
MAVPAPQQVAPDVYLVTIGRGAAASNVYLVCSGSTWTLVDAAWAGSTEAIRTAAAALFGPGARPVAILLTHIHPDHSGAAGPLARSWGVPVYVHADELPMAAGRYLPQYSMPLDRWVIVPIMLLFPPRIRARIEAAASITDVAQPLPPEGGVPGLADWAWVPTPGHTPGHVAYLRRRDGVLLAGDAALTVDLNSVGGVLLGRQRVAGPPRYTTWDWRAAKRSVGTLAEVEPWVLLPGHGQPLTTGSTAALAALVPVPTRAVHQAAVAGLRVHPAGAQPGLCGHPGDPRPQVGRDPQDQPGTAGARRRGVSGRTGRGVAVGPQRPGRRWPGGARAARPAARDHAGRDAGTGAGPGHPGLPAAGRAASRARPGGP